MSGYPYPELERWICALPAEDRERMLTVLIDTHISMWRLPPSKARAYALDLLGPLLDILDASLPPADDDDVDLDWEVWGELLSGLRFE